MMESERNQERDSGGRRSGVDVDGGTLRRWPAANRHALTSGGGGATGRAYPDALLEAAPVALAHFAAVRDEAGDVDFECRYVNAAGRSGPWPGGEERPLDRGRRMAAEARDCEALDELLRACRELFEAPDDEESERRLHLPAGGGASGAEGGSGASAADPVLDLSLSRLDDGVLVAWRESAPARAGAVEHPAPSVELLTTLGHELRTPLNAMLGFCSLLKSEITGALNDEQRAHLSRIERSCRHLESLVDDSLALARGAEGEVSERYEEVDAVELAEDVVELMAPDVRSRSLRLEVDCPSGAVPLRTDGGKLRQILTNLVGNAVKYTEEGEVRVEVELEEDEGRVCIRVRDTGPGIPPERREEIFEPYVRLRERSGGGGEGLGLAVCRRLARLLGGEVGVEETVPGEGTTFALRLPRRPDEDREARSVSKAG